MNMGKLLVGLGTTWLGTCASAADWDAGYTLHVFEDEERQRPVLVELWYPTAAPAMPHHYGINSGQIAIDADFSADKSPLVLLLPGALGTASNYSWLAEALAQEGFVVMGVSHVGESPVLGADAVNPANAGLLGERTRDIRFALAQVSRNPDYSSHVDTSRITVVGHSSGGATALLLAGAALARETLVAYCNSPESTIDKGCLYPRTADFDRVPVPLETTPNALVLLDPALGPAFAADTLMALTTPVLVVAAVQNDFLPYAAHAGYIATHLPTATLAELDQGEGHFVFISTCTLPIAVMGVPLCEDREGVDRKRSQSVITAATMEFLRGR